MASSSRSHIETTSSNVGALINNQGGSTHIENIIVGKTETAIKLNNFNVPRLVQTFQGREKETEKLMSLFFEERNRKIVICGLPGFGKTELAKHFAKHCKNTGKVDNIIWVNAEKKEDLEQSFKKLSESVGVTNLTGNSLVYYIYEQCEHFVKRRSLFIYDNGLSRQCIVDYEPPDSDNYFLLVTSREKDWGDEFTSFPLNPLTENSASVVMKSILAINHNEEILKLYRELADIVGNVPLGLQIVAAYVRQGIRIEGEKFCLKEYVEEMKTSQEKFVKKIPRNSINTYEYSLYGAMQMSLSKINTEENVQVRDLALTLLFVCCYLHPDYIYREDLIKIAKSTKLLLKYKNGERKIKEALTVLDNYLFIMYKPDQIEISIHRFIQEILLFHLRESDLDMQGKCYNLCLEFLLPDKFLHISTILKHADDNLEIFFNFYKKHKHNLLKESYIAVKLMYSEPFTELRKGKRASSSRVSYKTGLQVFLENIFNAKCLNSAKKIFNNLDYENEIDLLNKIIYHNEMQWNVQSLMALIELRTEFKIKISQGDYFRDMSLNIVRSNYLYNYNSILKIILNNLNCEEIQKTTNEEGETLVHVSAALGMADMVELLIIKKQMDVNKQDFKGRTPLHTILYSSLTLEPDNKRKIVKQLVRNGASLDIKDSKSVTPLELIKNDYFLVRTVLVNIKDMKYLQKLFDNLGGYKYLNEIHLLHRAAYDNKIDLMKLVLQYGVSVNSTNSDLRTPLHEAARGFSLQAIEVLLQYNANLDARNKDGNTPLFEICSITSYSKHCNMDEADKILRLFKCEENKNITNNKGETILHIAAFSRQDCIIKLLVNKYQMNVNAQDSTGSTPLHTILYLPFGGKLQIYNCIYELIKGGALLDIRNNAGQTSVQIAQMKNVEHLINIWINFNKPLK